LKKLEAKPTRRIRGKATLLVARLFASRQFFFFQFGLTRLDSAISFSGPTPPTTGMAMSAYMYMYMYGDGFSLGTVSAVVQWRRGRHYCWLVVV